MPWTPEDAHSKTHKAPEGSGKDARRWAHIANRVLEETHDEGRAIREANGIIRKGHGGVGGTRDYSDD